jgi:hypothetical protein
VSISPSLRFSVLRRDGFTCRYCGRRPPAIVLEVDHVTPKSKGGANTEANLVSACFVCNRGKRDAHGVLPPPGPVAPIVFPVGLFFNAHNEVAGEPPVNGRRYVWAQGWVLSISGDEIWCQVFDENGEPSLIRALPRHDWRGWDFFVTSREMRLRSTIESYHAGFCEWSDVERFEEYDSILVGDNQRLRAFYAKHPEFSPSGFD